MFRASLLRAAAPYRALAWLAARLEKLPAAVLKKDRVTPDPGGMRDEMEREFVAREMRSSR